LLPAVPYGRQPSSPDCRPYTMPRGSTLSSGGSAKKKAASKSSSSAEGRGEIQRQKSPAEFFADNQAIAGFDNYGKSLYTSIRELMENSLVSARTGTVLQNCMGCTQCSRSQRVESLNPNQPLCFAFYRSGCLRIDWGPPYDKGLYRRTQQRRIQQSTRNLRRHQGHGALRNQGRERNQRCFGSWGQREKAKIHGRHCNQLCRGEVLRHQTAQKGHAGRILPAAGSGQWVRDEARQDPRSAGTGAQREQIWRAPNKGEIRIGSENGIDLEQEIDGGAHQGHYCTPASAQIEIKGQQHRYIVSGTTQNSLDVCLGH